MSTKSTKKEEQKSQEPVNGKASQTDLLQALIALFTIKRLRDHKEDK